MCAMNNFRRTIDRRYRVCTHSLRFVILFYTHECVIKIIIIINRNNVIPTGSERRGISHGTATEITDMVMRYGMVYTCACTQAR